MTQAEDFSKIFGNFNNWLALIWTAGFFTFLGLIGTGKVTLTGDYMTWITGALIPITMMIYVFYFRKSKPKV